MKVNFNYQPFITALKGSLYLFVVFGLATPLVLATAVERLPPTAQYAASTALGEAQPLFHIKQDGSHHIARRDDGSVRAYFSKNGVEIGTLGATWSIKNPRLATSAINIESSLSFTGGVNEVNHQPPLIDKNRAEYRHQGFTEWYHNGPLGLQQGFTIAAKPDRNAHNNSNNLKFLFDLDGATAHLSSQQSLVIKTASNNNFDYSGLVVYDAVGITHPAQFSLSNNAKTIEISIDDQAAVYPLTIDPMIEQHAYVKASNTESEDFFGYSIALDGDTLVLGAPEEDSNATGVNNEQNNNSLENSGAVYVFTRSGATWSQQAYIKASNTGESDQFGRSVALNGDTLVVGAPFEDSDGTGVDGGQSDDSLDFAGAVYVFVRNGEAWTQQAYIKASNPGISDQFGWSVAIDGDTLVVGAHREASDATGINQDQNNDDANVSGAVYVFTRAEEDWSQQAYIKASNTEFGDLFGSSVALDGDTLLVGAVGEDSGSTGVNNEQDNNDLPTSGAAYLFTRADDVWSQQAYIKASDPVTGDQFGITVSLDGDTFVVGAGLRGGGGGAYVFNQSEGVWSEQTFLAASNQETNDKFGISVSLEGDTLLIGASGEGSNATGVNGDQANNSEQASGAAYLFTRSDGIWTQELYLKASNPQQVDLFGFAVALDGDTLAASAYFEDSGATGVNGNQTDNSEIYSGAAYVFGPESCDFMVIPFEPMTATPNPTSLHAAVVCL